jgi:hypothetical protein
VTKMRIDILKKLKKLPKRAGYLFLAFLVALTGLIWWHPSRAHAQTIFLTTGTSWTVPSDWNNSSNTIETIGGGGLGGDGAAVSVGAGGGGAGGGGYAISNNVSLTAGLSVTMHVGAGGTSAFPAGGDTYLCNSSSNCTSATDTAVIVGSSGGGRGGVSAGGTAGVFDTGSSGKSGGAGGSGRAGSGTSGGGGGGGGGAAGGQAAGVNGGNAGSSTGAAGGQGDGTFGGLGGSTSGGAGSNGTEWDATHGSGGGSGAGNGGGSGASGFDAGTAGSYGAGGGGGGGSGKNVATGGAGANGAQGLITVTYTVVTATFDQNSYQWLTNADSVTPGGKLNGVSQNTATTLTSAGQAFRLRQLIKPSTSLSASAQSYNEQYAALSTFGTCSAIPNGNWSNMTGSSSVQNFAQTGTNVTTTSHPWTSPGNISANDATSASVTLSLSQTSDQLWATNHGFSIPTNAVVQGIQATVRHVFSSGSGATVSSAYLIKNGVIGATNKGGAAVPSTFSNTSFGSSSDLWGDTWTPSDINNSNFGFVYAASLGSTAGTVSVDSISISVTYSTSGLITYKDNPTPVSGDAISTTANDPTESGQTVAAQTYQEADSFTNTSSYGGTVDGMWDLALYDNGAPAGTTYCLRTVKSDGTALDSYSFYPQITTASTNSPPSAPTLSAPSSGATNVSTTPTFSLSTTDPDSDAVTYRIYLYQSDCSTVVGTSPFAQASSGTGWDNGTTAYTSGATANYTYQGTLSNNTQYCWKADAVDPAGSNTYGSASATQSFTTAAASSSVNIGGGTTIRGGTAIQ